MYDLTITALRRPDLVERCLSGVREHVPEEPERVLVNIDPVGPATQQEVAGLVRSYFPQAEFRMPEMPDFPSAVQWLWRTATSPMLLHVEDSKEFHRPLPWAEMVAATDVVSIACRAINKYKPVPKEAFQRSDGLWQVPWFGRSVMLQPTLWRTSVCRDLTDFMRPGVSPEKTIRAGPLSPTRHATSTYMSQYQFGYTSGPGGMWYFRNHGADWRRAHGFKKKGGHGIPDTYARGR